MAAKLVLNYFVGDQADMFSFYRIPKQLFTSEYFKEISCEAKILYGLMLDRVSLSIKNQWMDEENRAYIYFTIEDCMELLGCGRNKAVKCMKELDSETGIGLIEKRRQGFGKSNIIYVKNFTVVEERAIEEKKDDTEVSNVNYDKFENETSRSPESKLQEVPKSNLNNTKYNNTKKSETESIYPSEDLHMSEIDRMEHYRSLIEDNIRYLDLCDEYDDSEINELVDLMVDVICSDNDKIPINGGTMPKDIVMNRFLKLGYEDLYYVLEMMNKTTTKINNIRTYMLTVLYNAPSTRKRYYAAEVNHGMYGETLGIK